MPMAELQLRTRDLSWRELDGEIVALDGGRSLYVATNPTGTLLWRKLVAGTTRDELVDDLVASFAVAREKAAVDVDRFVADLRANGLLSSP
jgi:coenzyme PQQ synthesis protein D (PqqD)